MAEAKFTTAKAVYDTVCEALSEKGWRFKGDDENLQIKTGAVGEDLPMDIAIDVNADRQLLLVISPMSITVPEDKRVDIAIAISVINNQLVDGCFDYDIRTGHIFFRLTSSFIESKIGKEAAMYMLLCSCQTIDEYNDKLLMLAKGLLSVEQFIASENE